MPKASISTSGSEKGTGGKNQIIMQQSKEVFTPHSLFVSKFWGKVFLRVLNFSQILKWASVNLIFNFYSNTVYIFKSLLKTVFNIHQSFPSPEFISP